MQAPLLAAENAELIDSQYVVVLKKGLAPEDIEEHHNVLAQMIQGEPGANAMIHVYETSGLNGYAGTFSASVLESIRKLPQVEYVEQDQVVYALDTQKNAPWGLARISHREALTFRTYNRYAHDPNGGKNVTVYIIDTGVNVNHVDFGGRAVWGATIPSNDQDIDGNGHGTHCAGTVAGSRYGVAKQARVVAVKVLRSNGSGTMSDVVRGVEWALQDHQQRSKGNKAANSVANMSLGGGFSRALNQVVDAAVDGGVHFAVAAGNDDADACDYSPASSDKAITVGASTLEDERAYFSNKGKCVDVFGPGKDITSTWVGSNTATNTISGTSMASPHVAGLLAYTLSLWKGPAPSTKELKQKLIDSATPNKLDKVPKDTPNKLIWNDPPSELTSAETMEELAMVEAAAMMEMVMREMLATEY
jgi:cerevisin